MIDLQPLTVGAKSKYLGEGKKTHRFRLYAGQTHAATCHVVASPTTLRRRTCLRRAPSSPNDQGRLPVARSVLTRSTHRHWHRHISGNFPALSRANGAFCFVGDAM